MRSTEACSYVTLVSMVVAVAMAPGGGTMTRSPVATGTAAAPANPVMGMIGWAFRLASKARLSGPTMDISAPVSIRKDMRRAVRWSGFLGSYGVRPGEWGTRST